MEGGGGAFTGIGVCLAAVPSEDKGVRLDTALGDSESYLRYTVKW
jgi:hypothetical protein